MRITVYIAFMDDHERCVQAVADGVAPFGDFVVDGTPEEFAEWAEVLASYERVSKLILDRGNKS